MPTIETPNGVVYPGVWLGRVLKVDDAPMGQRTGKLRVEIPDVYGDLKEENLPWAYPIFPGSVSDDNQSAAFFAIPAKGANVAVLFERGDPQSPRWIGGWCPKGKIPFQLQFAEGDGWPNIEAWRAVDGMMIRFVVGKRIEINLGKSGKFKDGEFQPDGVHNEFDTAIVLDKQKKKITVRAKYDIDIQCKGKISVKATQIRVKVMPNQQLADDGESWENVPGSTKPRWELNVFDPEAGQGARVVVEPGSLVGSSRSAHGFEDR